MRLPIKFFLLTLTMVAVAPIAFAGHHYGHGCNMSTWNMTEIDADGDGVVTFDEFSSRQQQKLRAGYDMIDGNKDGVIDDNEWSTFLEVHGMTNDG